MAVHEHKDLQILTWILVEPNDFVLFKLVKSI